MEVIGGTKKVHVDKVAALKPDFVIANKEENTKEDIDAIAEFCPVYVSDIKTPYDTTDLITVLGNIFEKTQLAAELNQQLSAALPSGIFNGQRIAYLIWKNPYMTIGGDTYIQSIIKTI